MARNISDAVKEICLFFPEAEEAESHGKPVFKVNGKTFAMYNINHHGDGRVALWLEAPAGAQALYTENEPQYYFVPPYVGNKGWLGVELDKGLKWDVVADRVREAYEKVSPAALKKTLGPNPEIKLPVKNLKPEEIDPLQAPRARKFLQRLDSICLSLPESARDSQFGNPVWKAGKKTFACVHRYDQRLSLQAWVGLDQQSLLVSDSRYTVPAYVGHNGWIDLNVETDQNWAEIEQLVLGSYRHFALQRMLKALAVDE